MTENRGVLAIIRAHKTLFIIILVGLFLIELEIFAIAVMKSGRKSWLQVVDKNGNIIHEADGKNLSQFNKYYFEKTFGPLENYDVRLRTQEIPFPFRAWFVAAVGLPVGIVLIFGFVIRAYVAIFQGETHGKGKPESETKIHENRVEMLIDKISRLNIFAIGFLIFVGVISYWTIPNLITYIGKTGIETIIRFKWLFLAVGIIFLGIVLWIIYLRFLLAKKSIESQMELDKLRLQLEFNQQKRPALPLESGKAAPAQAPTVEWREADVGRRTGKSQNYR